MCQRNMILISHMNIVLYLKATITMTQISTLHILIKSREARNVYISLTRVTSDMLEKYTFGFYLFIDVIIVLVNNRNKNTIELLEVSEPLIMRSTENELNLV